MSRAEILNRVKQTKTILTHMTATIETLQTYLEDAAALIENESVSTESGDRQAHNLERSD